MEELLKEKLLLEAEIKKLNDKLNENYVKRNESKYRRTYAVKLSVIL